MNRCLFAEPYRHGCRCTNCGEPFSTLTEFEQHIRDQELVAAKASA